MLASNGVDMANTPFTPRQLQNSLVGQIALHHVGSGLR